MDKLAVTKIGIQSRKICSNMFLVFLIGALFLPVSALGDANHYNVPTCAALIDIAHSFLSDVTPTLPTPEASVDDPLNVRETVNRYLDRHLGRLTFWRRLNLRYRGEGKSIADYILRRKVYETVMTRALVAYAAENQIQYKRTLGQLLGAFNRSDLTQLVYFALSVVHSSFSIWSNTTLPTPPYLPLLSEAIRKDDLYLLLKEGLDSEAGKRLVEQYASRFDANLAYDLAQKTALIPLIVALSINSWNSVMQMQEEKRAAAELQLIETTRMRRQIQELLEPVQPIQSIAERIISNYLEIRSASEGRRVDRKDLDWTKICSSLKTEFRIEDKDLPGECH